MRTEVKLCCVQHAYEAPSMEIIGVATEAGFALSTTLEDVGKDEGIEF